MLKLMPKTDVVEGLLQYSICCLVLVSGFLSARLAFPVTVAPWQVDTFDGGWPPVSRCLVVFDDNSR